MSNPAIWAYVRLIKREAKQFLRKLTEAEIEAYRTVPVEDLIGNMGGDSKAQKEAMEGLMMKDAVMSALTIKTIASRIMSQGYDDRDLPFDMYHLGFACRGLKEIGIRTLPAYKQFIHSTLSAEIIEERRYKEYREDYEQAIEEAKQYWENGGPDLHDDVAMRLSKKYYLNHNGLKKRLAPIAREYGRCFGLKGITKST